MPYIQVNDIHLYYEEMGQGAPLVLLHAALGAIDYPNASWQTLAPRFAEQYHVLQIEHRGHGRTTNPRDCLSYALIADDICQFLEQLALHPAHIAGVSDGGIVALHIGMIRPDLAWTLICVGTNYYNDALVQQANEQLIQRTRVEQAQPDWIDLLHDRNKAPGYHRTLYRHVAENLAVNPAYTTEDLHRIPVPTLLMAGEDDLWGNLDQMVQMRRNIPRAEILIINHAGHTIQQTHPHIVGPVVLDFLARKSGNKPADRVLS